MLRSIFEKAGIMQTPPGVAGAGRFFPILFDGVANPYDLRPAADIITGKAAEMLEEADIDRPLVILMGEYHHTPAHKELQHMVAARFLAANEKFTMNFEHPHNSVYVLADSPYREAMPETLKYAVSEYDPDGRAALSFVLGYMEVNMAPVSADNLMAFCYANNIPAAFTDAAKFLDPDTDIKLLDRDDRFTAEMAALLDIQEDGQKIPSLSEGGVAIRNMVMVARGLAHARKHESRLIVQQAGNLHVMGDPGAGLDYYDSLAALYREAGALVLPVRMAPENTGVSLRTRLADFVYGMQAGSIHIENLAKEKFYAEEYADKNNLGFSQGAEEAFIRNGLYPESGNELTFYAKEGYGWLFRERAEHEIRLLKERFEAASDAGRAALCAAEQSGRQIIPAPA